jgi:hypothetical protein
MHTNMAWLYGDQPPDALDLHYPCIFSFRSIDKAPVVQTKPESSRQSKIAVLQSWYFTYKVQQMQFGNKAKDFYRQSKAVILGSRVTLINSSGTYTLQRQTNKLNLQFERISSLYSQ